MPNKVNGLNIQGKIQQDDNGKPTPPQSGGQLYQIVDNDPTNTFFQGVIADGYKKMKRDEEDAQ